MERCHPVLVRRGEGLALRNGICQRRRGRALHTGAVVFTLRICTWPVNPEWFTYTWAAWKMRGFQLEWVERDAPFDTRWFWTCCLSAQLVWYRSNQVGCAMASCPNAAYKYFYVCHYCPPWVKIFHNKNLAVSLWLMKMCKCSMFSHCSIDPKHLIHLSPILHWES